jgi:hypothetical protein
MAAMGLHNYGVAALERPPTETTKDIIETAHATWHEGTQQHGCVAIKACPSHRRDSQANRAIDHALMQHLADLSDPIVHIDFGASQTERRLATHRDEVLPLATMLTVILDRAHLVGIATVEHLLSETVIVAGIVARVDVFEALPVIDKDLFEDVGVLSRGCHHQIAPSKGVKLLGIERFYHVSRSASTPSSVFTRAPSHRLSRPGDTGISGQRENAFSFYVTSCCQAPWSIFSPSPFFGRSIL